MRQPEKIGMISRREFDWLSQFKELSDVEQKKVDQFNQANSVKAIQNQKKDVEVKKVTITKSLIWKNFKTFYQHETGNEFIENDETLENVAPIIEYFAKDQGFFLRNRLVKKIGSTALKPSFDKGLLIVGAYGNGKTTIMKSLGLMFNHFQMPMKFKCHNVHDMVTRFESIGADKLSRESSKFQFYETFSKTKGLYMDDVKKEREASNFGKVNLIREIIEKRYDVKGLKTYITCNYREGDSEFNIEDALIEFGERYGGHIYDRLFAMFNIIEFKGKTFR